MSTATILLHRQPFTDRSNEAMFILAVVGLALMGGGLSAYFGFAPLVVIVGGLVFSAIAIKPELGAYLYLIASPLIVGIARDSMIPILRPNEALFLLIVCALATRIFIAMLRDDRLSFDVDRVDLALLLLALSGSVFPLLMRYVRELPISSDDVLYALVLWKYLLVFRFFREAIRTPSQVTTCLWLSIIAALLVGVVAMLQVSELLAVPQLLVTYYDDPFEGSSGETITDRGTSTIASSFGVANVMVMNLALVITWLAYQKRHHALFILAGFLLLFGCITAGQISGYLCLMIAVPIIGLITGQLRRLALLGLPAIALAALLFLPVILERLAGFEGPQGLPPSWVGRIDNLQRFVLPTLLEDLNWMLSVRPAARVAAPETWRDWVFIESGYMWLLWSGGVPMLLAFAYFVRSAFKALRVQLLEDESGPIAIAASAVLAWLLTMAVLMLFDPHLTMRGSADLFFPLLALGLVRVSQDGVGKKAVQ